MLSKHSPTPLRDFIWLGEYANGNHLAEFDFLTAQKNDFYEISKQDLIRFGLVGHGYHFYHDVFGGSFHLPQGKFDFVYKHADKEIKLTEQPMLYNDIITYKKAESTFSPAGFQSGSSSQIVEYVFGYKQKLVFDDININVKAQFSIPFGTPMYISVRLVSNQELDGKLQIVQSGVVIDEINAPLIKDVGGEVNWMVS